METKTCTRCGIEKSIDEFAVRKGYKGGHHTWCKPCVYAQGQDWRHRNPDKARAIYNRAAKTEQAGIKRRANRKRIAEETGKAYDHDYMVAWRAKNVAENPDFFWESNLRHNYQMSRERYDALLAKQNGGCAICGGLNDTDKRLCVDHDHGCCPNQKKSCGKCVRGLLCSRCNHMLGHAKDNPGILAAGITYLNTHQKQ
jgi:hypothetical protein